jgi:hypothetical protein
LALIAPSKDQLGWFAVQLENPISTVGEHFAECNFLALLVTGPQGQTGRIGHDLPEVFDRFFSALELLPPRF